MVNRDNNFIIGQLVTNWSYIQLHHWFISTQSSSEKETTMKKKIVLDFFFAFIFPPVNNC